MEYPAQHLIGISNQETVTWDTCDVKVEYAIEEKREDCRQTGRGREGDNGRQNQVCKCPMTETIIFMVS